MKILKKSPFLIFPLKSEFRSNSTFLTLLHSSFKKIFAEPVPHSEPQSAGTGPFSANTSQSFESWIVAVVLVIYSKLPPPLPTFLIPSPDWTVHKDRGRVGSRPIISFLNWSRIFYGIIWTWPMYKIVRFYRKRGFLVPPSPPPLSDRFCKKSEKIGKI